MTIERARISVHGAVQGVGFRPFVFRLAHSLQLTGWVRNAGDGLRIEIEGDRSRLDRFLRTLEEEKPVHSLIHNLEVSYLEPRGEVSFEILHSETAGAKTAWILPDIATCEACVGEIFDPADRRHLYPFTACTHCGPRFSILESLPYDRPNTSMKGFAMCATCDAEYHDPHSRRFHAQPNACPDCGPQLQLLDAGGRLVATRHEALQRAAESLRQGGILALKGLGGFHLATDARNDETVRRLRHRKGREEKPLALMAPDLDAARALCRVSAREARLLSSPQAPIVLLERQSLEDGGVAPSVAPENPNLGIMLPSTPLHHLLLRELRFPIVATSANLTDEPICIDGAEARLRLAGIADHFLDHDRPIVRHMDDSIVRVLSGVDQVLRRARGYAPLPVRVSRPRPLPSLLGVGAHLKSTVARSLRSEIFVSQHIGDLETPAAQEAFHAVCRDFQTLHPAPLEGVACDQHAGYVSSQSAAEFHPRRLPVQHHFAHLCACMAENDLEPPVLGIIWDGTGQGTDGTIWGGEFLIADGTPFTRAAHFRNFALPGGDAAIREPRRSALGVLYEISGDALFSRPDNFLLTQFEAREAGLLRQTLEKKINCPRTSSAGRLFDAAASLLGLQQRAGYEGQAAMKMEFAARGGIDDSYSCELRSTNPIIVDWEPMLWEMSRDLRGSAGVEKIAARFHNALVEAALAVAQRVGIERVALSGGCFQNRFLTERLVDRLRAAGFRPFWHQRVPCHDGGIALGQIVAAANMMSLGERTGPFATAETK